VSISNEKPGPIYWLRDLVQLSMSLVEFRARIAAFPDMKQELSDLAQRLHALSHPILVSTDEKTGLVAVLPMLKDRWTTLHSHVERRDISGVVHGDELHLPVQQAIALNLAADEILRNSLRHAFPNRAGHVSTTVTYSSQTGNAVIQISDDGIGAPSAALAESMSGLGLVRELCRQLNASFKIVSDATGGTSATLRFSVPPNLGYQM
jgi:two-component sensor histidine kinase